MRRLIVTVVLLVGCGDSGIGPDPDATSSSGNSMGGSDGNGGAPTAGNAPTGGAPTTGGNGTTGGGVPGGGNESGTRLKVRTRVGADGSRQPLGWFDQNLSTNCTWRKASDGSERCLPEGISATRFADDECTQPLLVQSTCEPLDYALVSEDPDACGNRWRVFGIGPLVTPTIVYMKSGANCVSATVPNGDIYSTNAELPASMFVSATIEVED